MEEQKEKILRQLRRRLILDREFMADCAAYDDMDAMKWDPPEAFTSREEIRLRVSTEAHDILKTAVNLFDTHNPKWQILPRGPADGEKAESLERWLEWQMKIADQNGDRPASTDRLKHSAKYGRIAAYMDFLPYWCKEGTDEYKDAMANPFCVTVYPAAVVHHERGKYGLRWVGLVNNTPAGDCIDHWENYTQDPNHGTGIQSSIRKIEKLLKDDPEARVMYVDYTNKENRWCFAYLFNSRELDTELSIPEDGLIEFLWTTNDLKFIPWAISESASTPLLFSMHRGGLWENQCFLDTIADTTVIRRGWFPIFKHKSVGGKNLEVDFSGNEAVAELDSAAGEELEVMVPPPLDPGIREMMDRNSQKAASATGLKGLQNMNVVGNVQFASIQSMIQVSKSTLDPYLTCYQHNSVELAKLAFMWIQKTNTTITGYRTKTKNTQANKVMGEKINVSPRDFDPRDMIILCELLPTSPGDDLQRMNVFSQAKQIGLHVPDSEILERMNWGSPEDLEQKWMKEQINNTAFEMFKQMQALQLQMMATQFQQQQQAQMMAAQQQQQGAQVPPPEQMGGAQMMPGGPGNNPNQGGLPAAMSSPQETQTQTRSPGA